MAEERSRFTHTVRCQVGVTDPNCGTNEGVTVSIGEDYCEYNDQMVFTEIRRLYSEDTSDAKESFLVPNPAYLLRDSRTHGNKRETERSCRGFRAKLDGFLVKHKDFVFRNVDKSKLPKLESRADEIRNEGSYAVGTSIDLFFGFDIAERIRQFYRAIRAGDIIVGQVCSAAQSGMNLKFLCFDGTKRGFLEDLEVIGICTEENMIPKLSEDPAVTYNLNDKVRCEVLDISYTTRQVTVGMKGLKVSLEVLNLFPLGWIQDSELPLQYIYSKARWKSKEQTTYEQTINNTMAFNNPSLVTLASTLGIYGNDLSLMMGMRNSFPQSSMITAIREEQNRKVVEKSMKQGFEFSLLGDTDQALMSFSKVIVLDPNNLNGLIARGIIYSTRLMLEQAKHDLEAATKLNPVESVQKKKIGTALLATGIGFQNRNDFENALSCYVSCVDVLSGVANTLTIFVDVYQQIGQLPDKLHGILLVKMSELCEKLRTLISEEHLNKESRDFVYSPVSNPSPLEDGEVVSSSPTVQLSAASDDLSPVSTEKESPSASEQVNSPQTRNSGNPKDDLHENKYRESPTRSRRESRSGTRSRTRRSGAKSRNRSKTISKCVMSRSSSVETKYKRKACSSAPKSRNKGGAREPCTPCSGSEGVRSRHRTKDKKVSVEDQVSAFLENIEETALSCLVSDVRVTIGRNLPGAKLAPERKVDFASKHDPVTDTQDDTERNRHNIIPNPETAMRNTASKMGIRFGIRKKPKFSEDFAPVIFSSPSSSSASESSPVLLGRPKWIPIPAATDDEDKDQDVRNSSRADSEEGCESPSLRYLESRDFSLMKSIEDCKLDCRTGDLRASSSDSTINDTLSSHLPSSLVGIGNLPRFSERRVPAAWNLDLLEKVCRSQRAEQKSHDQTEISTATSRGRQFERSRSRSVRRVAPCRSYHSPFSYTYSRSRSHSEGPESPSGLDRNPRATASPLCPAYRDRSSSRGRQGQVLPSRSESNCGTPVRSSSRSGRRSLSRSRPWSPTRSRPRSQSKSPARSQVRPSSRSHSRSRPQSQGKPSSRSQSRSRPRSQSRSSPRTPSRSPARSQSRSRPRSRTGSRSRSRTRSRPRSRTRSRPRSRSRSSPRSSRSYMSVSGDGFKPSHVRRRRSPSAGYTSSEYEFSYSHIRGFDPNYVSPTYMGRNPIPASRLQRRK